MKASHASTDRTERNGSQYALQRDGDCWRLTFEGRQAVFRHERGAVYVGYLLRETPREPIHGVALALKAREALGQPAGAAEVREQQSMRLDEADGVRALWRRQRELERVLEDRSEIEPVKAEALRELEEITGRLRQSPWLSRHGAARCARAVGAAIRRFHAHLTAAAGADGKPDGVLRAFASHIHERVLSLSAGGCFIYLPPANVVWGSPSEVQSLPLRAGSNVQRLRSEVRGLPSKAVGLQSGRLGEPDQRPAALRYLSRFLCVGHAVALMATGCAGTRPLKGGSAAISPRRTGFADQTLMQSENPAQAARQNQEMVKVRSFTVPAGSRLEEFGVPETGTSRPRPDATRAARGTSTRNLQPSTRFVLSAPMPVVEREETRARAELGAAQKDTARELGARLASLKGIVWVGAGLFVFGLASLVWPPLKTVIASVTTSAALMLGGVALMVLPGMVAGNELLLLGAVGVAAGGWFLAHRHGELRGRVKRDA